MRQILREVSQQRTVGFGDAVDDLGTHVICGHEVPYSRTMVYNILKGKSRSERLLKRIIEFRPDLLELSWTEKSVIERAREMGWTPRSEAEQGEEGGERGVKRRGSGRGFLARGRARAKQTKGVKKDEVSGSQREDRG